MKSHMEVMRGVVLLEIKSWSWHPSIRCDLESQGNSLTHRQKSKIIPNKVITYHINYLEFSSKFS